jgi:hypothetical protein
MKTTDDFSEFYDDILDGQYDCVDRIVLNAYYVLGQTPGGFRTWWRQVHGTDENLTETAVMRYAGRFARRLRAYAKTQNIPILECGRGERKHEVAESYVPSDPNFCGVFCILYGRAPAPVREIRRFGRGGIDIRTKEPWPYVNYYHFHIMDPEWGHIIIRFCPHPPFAAKVVLNGHEYVERLACKRKLEFTKEGNCFTHFSSAIDLTGVAETMTHGDVGVGRLAQVCERWIYSSCLCFALDLQEQERCAFHYRYSVYQAEYSRNYLFMRGRQMAKLFDRLIDRTRTVLDIRSLKTIFGVKNRPYFKGPHGKPPRIELSVERPAYDLTVFKVHFGLLTVKMYSKGERVLRVETIIHNARRMKCGVGIDKFPAIVGELKNVLERFVQSLQCVNVSFIDANALENWPRRSELAGTPVAGVDINQPRMQAVLQAVMALAIKPNGFMACELAERVRQIPQMAGESYTLRQASYDLRKLRAKGVVKRIPDSLRYAPQAEGLRAATALLVLRNEVLVPLLANRGQRKRSGRCHMNETEKSYDNIQKELQHVFKTLGIAA